MKLINLTLFISTLALCLLSLPGCTKNPLKEQATEDGRQFFLNQVNADVQALLPPNHELYGTFISHVGKHAEIEISEVTEDAGSATVQIHIRTIPMKNIKVLAEIAGKQSGASSSKFNMGNAVQLIESQDGMVRGQEDVSVKLLYIKSGDRYIFDKTIKTKTEE